MEEQTKKNHVHTQCTYSKDTSAHFGKHAKGANGLAALADPIGHILQFIARYLKHWFILKMYVGQECIFKYSSRWKFQPKCNSTT